EVRTRGVVVSERSRAIHVDDLTHHREAPRGAPVRDDTVHVVPARKSRPAAAAARSTRRYARCLASPPRDQGRGRGRRGHPAGGARGRADRSPATGGRPDEDYFRALPAYRRELQRNELDAAERAGVDALVAVYHADHRELCAHERDYPLRIINVLEIVGQSMGLHHDDDFKRLKLMQDVDAIAAD